MSTHATPAKRKKPPSVKINELPLEVRQEYVWRTYSFWRAGWMQVKKVKPAEDAP